VGDEADKIARMVKSIIESGSARNCRRELRVPPTWPRACCARRWMRLRGWTPRRRVSILKEDDAIDKEFDGFVRKLITYMMEDPRTISPSLDLLFLAKAIERIGDHAKNIAEFIIYVVKGADVRHTPMETN
jgi:phosphate transport system protein